MIDLHTHSLYSDGILTVKQLIDNAIENNVETVSITDHDTIDGLTEIQNTYSKDNILVIPGVEFSTETYYLGKKTKLHLLGYGYKINDKSINDVLYKLYDRRSNDNMAYIDELIKKFPYLNREYFDGFKYGKYGWIHKNIVNHIREYISTEELYQLREYLINNKPHYNKYNESVEDMIGLMHSCNGYAVFAHPQKCDITRKELNALVDYLTNLGLDGIETYHIQSNQEDRKYIHGLAEKYHLYETGGSDFHSFKYTKCVGDPSIMFPEDYEPLLVKRLIKENKALGGSSE